MPRLPAPLLALLALVFAGCGGGGGGGGPAPAPAPSVIWLVQLSTDALDGHIRSDGTVATTGTCGFVGDIDGPRDAVGGTQVFSFDLSRIPAGATIDSASISLYQEAVVGDPFSSHGAVIVSHVDVGPTLDASDFWHVPLELEVGILSADAREEWKSVEVDSAVRRSMDLGLGRVDLALAWSRSGYSNGDGNPDFVIFNDGGDACGSGNRPTLHVQYRLP